jgi:hypothetical protein
MPIVQLMVLGLIISAFAAFIIVLMSVSIYVSIGKKEAAPATTVTPARRPDEAPVARETVAQPPSDARRFG